MRIRGTTTVKDLNDIVKGWHYVCPIDSCRNKTCHVEYESERLKYAIKDKETEYLVVRVLVCENCGFPQILGTNVYYDNEKGWGARGETMTTTNANMYSRLDVSVSANPPYEPIEYVAFSEPVQKRELPTSIDKKVERSFREAEYAVAKNKPISAAAAIRNTVRLLVEKYDINESTLKDSVAKLPFESEYVEAIGDLKIVGDLTLHYEEYAIEELQTALEVLALALVQHANKMKNLKKLRQAVTTKGQKRAGEQKGDTDE